MKTEKAEEQVLASPPPEELHTFTFRVRGHGHDLPAGTVQATNERKAFREAYKWCTAFELPGWSLVCVETGTSQPAVQFIDPEGEKKRA